MQISYILEKLTEKSRMALVQDETKCSYKIEEKKEDFCERDEFETEDEKTSIEEVKENLEIDDNKTELESDNLEKKLT